MSSIILKHQPVGELSDIITSYIEFKRLQGFKYIIEEHILYHFSVLSLNYEILGMEIPQPLLDKWFTRRPNEKISTFQHRCSDVTNFLKYAQEHGYKVKFPHVPKLRRENYIPYIFTESEISKFLHACDNIPQYSGSHRHVIMPVLFRLLYCCGLRVSEAAELQCSDVDLNAGILTIREPKNLRDRYVPMPKSLTNSMCDFHMQICDSEAITDGFFFPSKFNTHITRHQIYKWFRICIDLAGIQHLGKGKGPRAHDLRHTFCVHSLRNMCAMGRDIYSHLPVLSTYVGHKSIRATQQYLRLTAEIYPELLNQVTRYTGDVIPNLWEVTSNETD